MSSEAEAPEISSLFERLLRHRDMSLFLPFIMGFTGNITTRENPENPQSPDEGTPQASTNTNSSERIILINPFTQGMVVIEGTSSLDSLLRNLANKDGQPPASKASVDAMPCFKIGEGENEEFGGECVICLEEYEAGEIAKEMPCKHKFHANCIEKWLGIHGSCPVCRYKMPVDEEEKGNKREEQRREIWVSFSFNSGRRGGGDSNQNETTTPSSDSSDVSTSANPSPDQETEN
ncbi:E3 ubiquitin-protein ligase RING1-like [Melia azedarach]|uniref:E3 ubiquitin-protein ligase RING1-like n=1 Tax=Melia azedarach TaxID=155640 RepID=A0ACC1XJ22_MELAZ|nr:E3 ubiquitin-protein ligase RING1-like [Melia azedarach]